MELGIGSHDKLEWIKTQLNKTNIKDIVKIVFPLFIVCMTVSHNIFLTHVVHTLIIKEFILN